MKKIVLAVVVIALLGVLWFVFLNQQQAEQVSNEMPLPTSEPQNDIVNADADTDLDSVLSHQRFPAVNVPALKPVIIPEIKQLKTGSDNTSDSDLVNGLSDETNGQINRQDTAASLPIIDAISNQTGIPVEDFEKAFNQE